MTPIYNAIVATAEAFKNAGAAMPIIKLRECDYWKLRHDELAPNEHFNYYFVPNSGFSILYVCGCEVQIR